MKQCYHSHILIKYLQANISMSKDKENDNLKFWESLMGCSSVWTK